MRFFFIISNYFVWNVRQNVSSKEDQFLDYVTILVRLHIVQLQCVNVQIFRYVSPQ